MKKQIWDGGVYFGKLVAMAILIWAIVLTPVAVRAQDSCIIGFERFAIQSWDRLEACLGDANTYGFWGRGARRMGCNIEYISDSLQNAADYTSCMSLGRLYPK